MPQTVNISQLHNIFDKKNRKPNTSNKILSDNPKDILANTYDVNSNIEDLENHQSHFLIK